MAVKWFTHSFNKHLLNTYIPDAVVGRCIQLWTKQSKSLCSQSFHSGEVSGQQTRKYMEVRGELKRRGQERQRQWSRQCYLRQGAQEGHLRGGIWAETWRKCGTGSRDEWTAGEDSEVGACLARLAGGTARGQCGWQGSLSLYTSQLLEATCWSRATETHWGWHHWCTVRCWLLHTAGACWEYTGTGRKTSICPSFAPEFPLAKLAPKYITNIFSKITICLLALYRAQFVFPVLKTVCVCVCVCVCLSVCVCVYTYIYMYTHTHSLYIYIYI